MQNEDDDISQKYGYDYTEDVYNPRKIRKLARKGFAYIEPLEEPGSIYEAEIHGSAQRLLNVHRITKYVKFCKCCCLPQETSSVVVPFNCLDNKLDFGLGIYLYFYYIKFCIIMSIIIICLSCIPSMIFSLKYTYEIKTYCNKLTEKYNDTKKEIPIDLATNCSIFTDIGDIESISDIIKMGFFRQMSAGNIRYYRRIFSYNITGNDKFKTIDNVIIYFPLMYLLTGITVLIANFLLNLHVNLLVDYEDYKRTTPSDYTLLIHGVPKPKEGEILQDKLKKIVEEVSIMTGIHLEIYQIIPCLKIGEIYEKAKIKYQEETKLYHVYNLEKQKQLNRSKRFLESSDNLHYFHTIACFKRKTSVNDIKEKIDKIKKELKEKNDDLKANPSNYSGGTFFLVFSKISMQEAFYDFYPHSYGSKIIWSVRYFFECILFKHFVSEVEKKKIKMKLRIDVKHAAEAYEVQWENMGYSRLNRNLYTIISALATILLIIVIFFIIYGLNYLSYEITKHKLKVSPYIVTFISLIISLVMSISSQIGYYLLEKLIYLEKIEYRTDYIASYSLKITFFDFIITGLLPVISHYYLKGGLENNDLLYNNVLMIFICNVFLPPVLFYYSPTLVLKILSRGKAKLDLSKKKLENSTYTQRELNKLFENPSINIYYKYSYITNIIFNSAFYLPIFPMGMAIGFLGLVFTYLSEFCYLGSYKRPEVLNPSLNRFYIGNFKWSMFIFAVGDYIFIGTISKNLAIGMPLIILVVFFLICLIPLQSISFNFMGVSEGESKNVTYEQNSIYFSNDYEKLNPLTRVEGFIKYFNNLVSKNIISENDCNLILKKIKSIDDIDAYLKVVRNINNYSSSQEQNNILMKNKIALKTDNLFEKLNSSKKLPLLCNILTNREDYNIFQSDQFNRKKLKYTSEELWKLKDCLSEYSMTSAGISGALIFLGLKEQDIHDFIPFERNYNPWKVDWLFTPAYLEKRKKWIKDVRKYMDYIGEISDEEDTFVKFDQQESLVVDEIKKINEKQYEKEKRYRTRNSILFNPEDFHINFEEIQKEASKSESNEEKSSSNSQQTESKDNIMTGIKLNDIQLERRNTNIVQRNVNDFKKVFAEDNTSIKDKFSNSKDPLK